LFLFNNDILVLIGKIDTNFVFEKIIWNVIYL
jgi:hypothetical protein